MEGDLIREIRGIRGWLCGRTGDLSRRMRTAKGGAHVRSRSDGAGAARSRASAHAVARGARHRRGVAGLGRRWAPRAPPPRQWLLQRHVGGGRRRAAATVSGRGDGRARPWRLVAPAWTARLRLEPLRRGSRRRGRRVGRRARRRPDRARGGPLVRRHRDDRRGGAPAGSLRPPAARRPGRPAAAVGERHARNRAAPPQAGGRRPPPPRPLALARRRPRLLPRAQVLFLVAADRNRALPPRRHARAPRRLARAQVPGRRRGRRLWQRQHHRPLRARRAGHRPHRCHVGRARRLPARRARDARRHPARRPPHRGVGRTPGADGGSAARPRRGRGPSSLDAARQWTGGRRSSAPARMRDSPRSTAYRRSGARLAIQAARLERRAGSATQARRLLLWSPG